MQLQQPPLFCEGFPPDFEPVLKGFAPIHERINEVSHAIRFGSQLAFQFTPKVLDGIKVSRDKPVHTKILKNVGELGMSACSWSYRLLTT